jgi:hypothetical protein
MEAKVFAKSFQHLNLVDTTDIDPGHRLIRWWAKGLHVRHNLLVAVRTGIVEASHGHGVRTCLTNVD